MHELMECPLCFTDVRRGAMVCTGCGADVIYGQSKRALVGKFILTLFAVSFASSSLRALILSFTGMLGIDMNGSLGEIIQMILTPVFFVATIVLTWLLFNKYIRRPGQVIFRRHSNR